MEGVSIRGPIAASGVSRAGLLSVKMIAGPYVVAGRSAIARLRTTDGHLSEKVCQRAVDARDPRFDGLFVVAITTTRVYCRPVCPARVSYPERRRFFPSAAAAERAGFRPCLRCRPELAPGRAPIDAISCLARAAERRIAGGALNGHSVADLAQSLGVSARHLRRALQREIGASPVELAQTHRLLMAKRLLADTSLSVTQVAYASGFQSLRRFNHAFRSAYRMPPSAVRRRGALPPRRLTRVSDGASESTGPFIHLTLVYRPPLAWDVLLRLLAADTVDSVETVRGGHYSRTAQIAGRTGVVIAEKSSADVARRRAGASENTREAHVRIGVSASLVPVLMPLLMRLRQLFDLDAEPTAIDRHLAASGLAAHVREAPGLRIPGGFDGFDIALRTLLRGGGWPTRPRDPECDAASRVAFALGQPIKVGDPHLSRLMPSPERIAEAGVDRLVALDVQRNRAEGIVALAQALVEGRLSLDPGSEPTGTRTALREVTGADEQIIETIIMRTLGWPDAFPTTDRALLRIARAAGSSALEAMAERWRPWRSYAALHLWLRDAAVAHVHDEMTPTIWRHA